MFLSNQAGIVGPSYCLGVGKAYIAIVLHPANYAKLPSVITLSILCPIYMTLRGWGCATTNRNDCLYWKNGNALTFHTPIVFTDILNFAYDFSDVYVSMIIYCRMPLMDVLVHVAATHHFNPSDYAVYNPNAKFPSSLTPSTAIGELNTAVVHIIPKDSPQMNTLTKHKPSIKLAGVASNGEEPFEVSTALKLPHGKIFGGG